MHRARDIVYDSFCITIGVLVASAVLFIIFQGWNAVPTFLGANMPSVRVIEAHATMREKERACFDIKPQKLRRGLPLKPVFHVETPASPELGLSVYRVSDKGVRLPDKLPEHQIGEVWLSHYCADLPGTVTPDDRLRVRGYLLHMRWFGRVVEPIPQFDICPVGKTECASF